jgi:hypothetical protein
MPNLENPGRYAAQVNEAEFGESQTGTPYVVLRIATDGGAFINAYLYLSEKALANSVKTLRDAFDFNGDFETLVEQVVTKPCSITVETEVYEGKERLRVKWINGPRTSKPIDNQEAFLKALSAKAARIPKDAPKPAPKAAPSSAPTRPAPAPAPKPATNPF